ncbi:MAG: hypothetical protein IJS04_02225 [Muribaculaceae bacterium]|nr:hypothetical protein [Muribaculaceae bacterium]
MKCVVYWRKCDPEAIKSIRDKFGIPYYTTVNGESPCEVDDEQMALLKQCEARGFLQIRNKKWCKIGDLFVW